LSSCPGLTRASMLNFRVRWHFNKGCLAAWIAGSSPAMTMKIKLREQQLVGGRGIEPLTPSMSRTWPPQKFNKISRRSARASLFVHVSGGCGSEDELTPLPAGHKFAQCNNPTSLFALDHAVASPLPVAMLCPKNSRLLRRDGRTGQKFAYVYFPRCLRQSALPR